MTHYPIQDSLFGLSQEQSQLRETVFKFCQKELAPLAQEIDRLDDFAQRREFWKQLGQVWTLTQFFSVSFLFHPSNSLVSVSDP